MTTTTELNWTKDGTDRLCGDYRIKSRSGYFDVYNGQPEPVAKKLSLKAARRFVEEQLAPAVTPAEIEAAYDAACICMPEINAAMAKSGQPDGSGTHDENSQTEPDPETPELTKAIERVQEHPEVKAVKAAAKLRAGNANDPAPKPAREKAKDVQALADELVWKHGKNAWQRGDLPDLLKAQGLQEEDLNDRVREKALEHFDSRLKRNLNAEKLTWTGPFERKLAGEWDAHVWETECGMYKVIRVSGAEPRYMVVAKIIAAAAKEKEVANDLKTLREALERAEDYHKRQMDLPSVRSNKDRILDEAVALGLHKRPQPQNYNPEETEESEMHVSEKKVGVLLTSMGLPDVENWSISKLTKAVNDIATVTAGANLPEDKGLRMLYKSIRRANEEGKKISVGEVSAEPAGKPGKGKSATEKTKPGKPAGSAGGIDRFGSRLGSDAAKFNSLLSSKPKTMKEIMEEGGFGSTFYNHARKLVEGGYVVKDGKGFKLAKVK